MTCRRTPQASTSSKEVGMTADTEKLGGRLTLLDPRALSPAQKAIYDRISATFGSWADRIHFQSKTGDGRLIGPFNPILFQPGNLVKLPRPARCRRKTHITRPATPPRGHPRGRPPIQTGLP